MKVFKNQSSRDLNTEDGVLHVILESLDNFLDEGVFRLCEDRTMLFANGAFVKMFGFSVLSELRGLPFGQLYADDESAVYLLDKINAEGIVLKHRVLCRRKDGGNFWAEVSGRKVTRDNRSCFEGMIYDISDQIEVEDKLRQKESQLDKLTMEMDRFIYSASHEIRSPICTLMGIVNLMKHDLKEESAGNYIEMLSSSLDRLDHIVSQLTVHVKNFKNRIDDKLIDFDSLLSGMLGEFRENHQAFSLADITSEVKNSGVFYSDPGRLRVILLNVLKNAFDYIDRRKTVRTISISIETKPETAFIEIFDNGIGIASSHVERVFDMFYRANDVTKGSGIGLYTARESVTKLGGIITLYSEYGVGTSVHIELPNSRTGKLINKKKLLRAITY